MSIHGWFLISVCKQSTVGEYVDVTMGESHSAKGCLPDEIYKYVRKIKISSYKKVFPQKYDIEFEILGSVNSSIRLHFELL
jgi:hypothetical protein